MSDISTQGFAPGIICHIELPPIRDDVLLRIQDQGYRLKGEFHITLVSAALRALLTPEHVRAFEEFTAAVPDLPMTFDDRLYAISKPKILEGQSYERDSLVVPVASPEILAGLGSVAARLQIATPEPFLHVTVSTRPDTTVAARGIGVESAADWAALSPQIFAANWKGV